MDHRFHLTEFGIASKPNLNFFRPKQAGSSNLTLENVMLTHNTAQLFGVITIESARGRLNPALSY